MNFENFSFEKFDSLNFNDQKEYIKKYFIPLDNGDHCMLVDGKYKIITKEILNNVYLVKCDKKIKDFYHKEHKVVKTLTYQLGKPIFFDNKINLCPQLPVVKPYKDFSDDIKKKVELMLGYMKEILSSGKENVYNYLTKWTANMCKGNKNDAALVLKTYAKGSGKSTYPVFIRKHVIPDLTLESSSEPLKNKFNTELGGKLFVYFEELETFSANEWIAVSSVLKRIITSDTMRFEEKGQTPYHAQNINNYMLLSNHDVDDDGRRFFVADVSTHRKGDRDYWVNLYKNCFNDEVGYAFYCYMREINTDNFMPQDFPITSNKLNSISKRLDSVYLFLKEEYILTKKSINVKSKDFYTEYQTFCKSNNKKPCQKTDFTTKLNEIQIKMIKTDGGNNKFKVSYEQLKAIADKNNWINELDEPKEEEEEEDENPLDHGVEYKFGKPKADEKDEIIDRQNKEIEELKAKLKQLEEQLKPKEVPKPTPKETIQEQLTFKDINDLTTRTIKSSKSKKGKTTIIKEDAEEDKQETKIIDDDIFGDTEFNKFLSMKKK